MSVQDVPEPTAQPHPEIRVRLGSESFPSPAAVFWIICCDSGHMLSIHQHLYAVSYNSHLLGFNECLFTGAFARNVQSQPTSQQPPTRAEVRNQAEEQIRNVFCDTHTACSMRWRGLYEWESCKRVPAATGMEHFSAKAMENPRDNQGSC